MNWLDITLIITIIIIKIVGMIIEILAINDYEWELGIGIFVFEIIIIFFLISPFVVIDKASGMTTGKITSVDKNFFGTTTIYIKTSEQEQEKYCIENNDELVLKANELLGKDVVISYGKRVGLYSTGKCSQSPVESINDLESEE